MTAHLLEVGNPSSLHASGRHARRVVEESRETDRAGAGLPSRRGRLHLRRHRGRQPRAQGRLLVAPRRRPAPYPHPGHLRRAPRRARPAALARGEPRAPRCGCCAVDARGRLDVDALRAAVERDPGSVALISVMWANNEVGTLQPIDEVVAHRRRARHPGAHRRRPGGRRGAGRLRPLRRRRADPDRAQGRRPVRRRRARRTPRARASPPLVHGGGQERDIRSGTIDPPAIAGFAAAVELAVKQQAEHADPGLGAARRPGAPGHRRRCPTRTCTAPRWTAASGCPATPTWASPAARATRC